ncbi:hypothetical protein LXL04_000469 [Taraxacum kok-saghyz]
MALMLPTPSFSFMNSSLNHDMKSHKLDGRAGIIHMHGILKFKSPTKVNATKFGSMFDPEKRGPNMVSNLGSGKMIEDDFVFQETFRIRVYEVGANQTASTETLMNHLLETTANHMKKIGLMDNGFGSEEMSKQNLAWVVAKIQMIVDTYPTWGDIVQIKTWKSAYGKNGVCCNLTFSDGKTGDILVKASSFWVMMNRNTRKISKFPNQVRVKLEQYLVDTPPIVEQDMPRTWSKKSDTIDEHVYKGLKPRWIDLDINQHVNHVKYIGIILESVPKNIMDNYEIDTMSLEYYKECSNDSVLKSFTSILANENGELANSDVVDCHHLLQFEHGSGSGNIMKGRTRWRLKHKKSWTPPSTA